MGGTSRARVAPAVSAASSRSGRSANRSTDMPAGEMGVEFGVRLGGAGLDGDLVGLCVRGPDGAGEQAGFVAGLRLVGQLAEHLFPGHDDLAGVADPEDLGIFAALVDAPLDPAG